MYYIKRSYYTPENIQQGKEFFELNCAVCHGNDADGTGIRSVIMTDAKPRMLTNLDWIESRDDLRLLRSIKYGVPGTAMIPWGDLTNSQQRLQLVMYIRSLSFEKERRRQLTDAVYTAFESAKQEIEKERRKQYSVINDLQAKLDAAVKEQRDAAEKVRDGKLPAKDAVAIYQKQLDLDEQLTKAKEEDQKWLDQEAAIHKQLASFTAIGNDFITANVDDTMWDHVLQLIAAGGKPSKEKASQEDLKAVVSTLEAEIDAGTKENEILMGRIASPQRDADLHSLAARVDKYKKLKEHLLSLNAGGTAKNE